METAERAGLTAREALRLLAVHGANALPQPKPPLLIARVARHLADPLSILLLIAGVVTLVVLREVPEGAAILVIPLLPVHLLWINLVLDGIPAIALGVDRTAGDPPPTGRLLSGRVLSGIAWRALVVGALVFAAVELARRLGWSDEQVRTQAVLALVYARLMLAYVVRARRWIFESGWWHGRAVAVAVLGTAALQTLMMPLGSFLALVPLPASGWAVALAVAVLTVALTGRKSLDKMPFGRSGQEPLRGAMGSRREL